MLCGIVNTIGQSDCLVSLQTTSPSTNISIEMTTTKKTATALLWIAILSIAGIGLGFAAGAATAAYKIGQASHIRAIRDNLSILKILANTSRDPQVVLSLTARAALVGAVCFEYGSVNRSNQDNIRSYVHDYNKLVNKSNAAPPLPPISDTMEYRKIREEYCAPRS